MPSDDSQWLIGRRALVTGGTSGIGLGAARRMVARGALVAVVGRDTSRGDSASAVLRTDGAVGAAYLRGDVGDPDECAALPHRAATELGGPVDIVVNVAGGGATMVSLEHTTPGRLRAIIGLNLESAILVTRAALPAMRDAGGGTVICVGGVHATRGMAGAPAYSAAKAGLDAFVRCLAIDEAAHGIVAACVHPGAVRTERLREYARRLRERGDAAVPDLRAAADPLDVGEWIAFLAGPAGRLFNGRSLELELHPAAPVPSA
jgi:NAD(P)-dependent dehydrogenase (short-subunit alcohol dehydrogenase family)